MNRTHLHACSLVALLVACGDGGGGKGPGADGTGDDTAAPDDTGDTGPGGPCADGGWGLVSDPEGAIHVRQDGDDTGDGSAAAPVASLDAALALARVPGATKHIAVGPGTYATTLQLLGSVDTAGTTDDGTTIEGCGLDEVTLQAADDDAPVLELKAVSGVGLAGLSVAGGRRAVLVWDGASVVATSMLVRDATEAGIADSGSDFFGVDITVQDIVPVSTTGGLQEQIGYGIAVMSGTLELQDSAVSGATGAGIYGAGADLRLSRVTVSGTAADSSGFLGRGVHLQDYAAASLASVELRDNADAGLFSLRSLALDVSDTTVTGVAAADCPACGGAGTGDGIVVTRGASAVGVENFQATLSGNLVDGADRSGVLLSGVTASLSGNTWSACGYEVDGSALLAQDGAVLAGSDTIADLEAAGVGSLPAFTEVLEGPAAGR